MHNSCGGSEDFNSWINSANGISQNLTNKGKDHEYKTDFKNFLPTKTNNEKIFQYISKL